MSLITYPVAADPRAFLPRSVSLAQDVNARSFASPFGGSEQAVDMLNDRWRLSIELPPCTQPDAAKREAFINALRGQVNHTELHHFGRPYPQGTLASCQGLVYDAPQGADSITIATTAGATLLAGDMLGVDGLLLQCRADCTADANGLLVVPLTNRLRRAVPGLRRASTATYVDGSGVLQTAGVDVPRYQGGQLLVEGAGTNLTTYSQDFSNASWAKNQTTITLDAVVGPHGSGAAKLVENTSNSYHGLWGGTGTVVEGKTYTVSIYVKPGGRSVVRFFSYTGVADVITVFNLATASMESSSALAPQLVARTDGWFRILHSFVAAASGESPYRCQLYMCDALGNDIYAGNGSAGVYVFGAQVEEGAAATSYIPTTTAPVTRAADILTPVVWQKPTAPFRLVGRPALRYVPGYSESLALDFVEKVD